MANTVGKLVAVGGVAAGAYKLWQKFNSKSPKDTRIKFKGDTSEYRVRLTIPSEYISGLQTSILKSKNGIIFPYTPQISFDNVADYATQNLTHSNYTIYSYKSSRVSAINLTAKFTVQNDVDAENYLAMLTVMRSLIKMRTGTPTNKDPLAGAPPPVCRLNAYGANMLNNVPVAVASFRVDLPAEVDYYSSNQSNDLNNDLGQSGYIPFPQTNLIPTVSTIVMSLIPMYSRNEMLGYNIQKWIDGDSAMQNRGYL
jgi:hypothetical protein